MPREHLVMFCYCDIAGQVRGKGFPVSQLPKRLRTGIGWTPTNIMLTAFGPIAESPWGPFGDLVVMPDPATQVDVEFGEDHPREHFFLGDRSEEHTSELQSRETLVCRLLLEKKKKKSTPTSNLKKYKKITTIISSINHT